MQYTLAEANREPEERAAQITDLRAQVAQLTAERDALAKFKAYTHQRMDELDVPYEVPDSEHTKAGCRIGGRFDWVRDLIAPPADRAEEKETEGCG